MKENMSQDELKKMRRMSYIKMVAMVGIVVAVIAFGSIAWFTMNREVEGEGVQMTSSDLPFEIATKGSKGIRNQSRLEAVDDDNKPGIITPIVEDEQTVNYYTTSGTTGKIMLRYDAGASEIGPGGRGQLNLYLVPKDNIDLKAKITLDVQGYAFYHVYKLDNDGNKIQAIDENHNPVYEDDGTTPVYQTTEKLLNVNSVTADMCTLTAEEINRIKQSAQYLKGHIMFFGGLGYEHPEIEDLSDDAQWYFEEPYTSRICECEYDNAEKGKMYEVPIYWMWPNTLGQIALKQPNSRRNGIPVVKDLTNSEINDATTYPKTDKAKVIQYLKDNKDIVLMNWNNIELTASELLQTNANNPNPLTKSQVVDNMIEHAEDADNFKRISECYNNADFAIGTDIKYFTIEITVKNNDTN